MTDISDTPLWKYQHSKPRVTPPWQFLAGLSAGAIVGVALAAPLIGWELPDANATMLGAALGAFVAVFGAFWLQGSESRERRRSLASAMVAIVSKLEAYLRAWRIALNREGETTEYSLNFPQARELSETAFELTREMFPTICQLDYRSARVVLDMQAAIKEFVADTEMDDMFYRQGTKVDMRSAAALETIEPLYEAVRHAHDHFCFVSAERP